MRLVNCAAAIVFLSLTRAATAEPEFRVIGDLPGGQNISDPSGLSADGSEDIILVRTKSDLTVTAIEYFENLN